MDDFDLAARQFLALVNADLQMITLFGESPTGKQLDNAARNAVRTFLRAYSAPAGNPAMGADNGPQRARQA